jgi:two-component system NtrC family sensor kinase
MVVMSTVDLSRQKTDDRDPLDWELAAQAITVRIRWFGICVGYALVNVSPGSGNTAILNSILALGALYALLDTYYGSLRREVFLSEWPLFTSLMEAVFIGLLCYFETGAFSPFRFYYFLSLLVCAIRYRPAVAWTTLGLHVASYVAVSVSLSNGDAERWPAVLLTVVMLGWMTWASTALAGLLKSASRHLTDLNIQLQDQQAFLEQRILERTRELQQSQAMLIQQEKQAAFGLLAAGIAHEVGNPLAAISSLVQLLNRREADERTRERLLMVDDQLRRIQRTLRELVDFSRPANNAPTLCDAHSAVNAALNIAKYYKRMKGKRIVTAYASGIPPIRVVRDQLVQVVLNLILNALDATEEGSTIVLRTMIQQGALRIEICDDGHGIAPAHHDRIFQPYFTTKETGTGLGLFVCRNIVEHQLHGRIELTKSSPSGTQFSLILAQDQFRDHPDVVPDVSEPVPVASPVEAAAS